MPSVLAAVCSTGLVAVLSLLFILRSLRKDKYWIGFFHPFSHAAGGGEKVLWCFVQKLLSLPQSAGKTVVIYTADGHDAQSILDGVQTHFGISLHHHLLDKAPKQTESAKDLLQPKLEFVFLHFWPLLLPWNFACLLMQGIGGIAVTIEALLKGQPSVFIDTCSFPYSLPTVRFLTRSRAMAYIHYPMASESTVRYNTSLTYAKSKVMTTVKILYYRSLLISYRWALRLADVLVANSNWTRNHLISGFPAAAATDIADTDEERRGPVGVVYPPCDMTAFKAPEPTVARENTIVSVAQFRPEKNHKLQLEAARILFTKYKSKLPECTKMKICGSAITPEQLAIMMELQEMVNDYGLGDVVQLQPNLPFPQLIDTMRTSKVAVHTMIDEHFGISIAEFLAAGLVVVSHNSGGPRDDILRPLNMCPFQQQSVEVYNEQGGGGGGGVTCDVGFLAQTADEFAESMAEALIGFDSDPKIKQMRSNAIMALQRLNSNEEFADKCVKAFDLAR